MPSAPQVVPPPPGDSPCQVRDLLVTQGDFEQAPVQLRRALVDESSGSDGGDGDQTPAAESQQDKH